MIITLMLILLKQSVAKSTSSPTSGGEPLSSGDGVRNLCCLTSSVSEKEFIDFSRQRVKLNERSTRSLDLLVLLYQDKSIKKVMIPFEKPSYKK